METAAMLIWEEAEEDKVHTEPGIYKTKDILLRFDPSSTWLRIKNEYLKKTLGKVKIFENSVYAFACRQR